MMSQSTLRDFIFRLLKDNGIADIEEVCFLNADLTPSMDVASQQSTAIVKLANKSPNLQLFLKTCRKNSLADTFNQTLLTFEKESHFYDSILPSFIKFEKEYSTHAEQIFEIEPLFIKCYGSGYVDGDCFIVLDKFLSDQYYVTSKTNFHSVDKVHFIMKSLAVFHATSFCMKHILHTNFLEEYPVILHDYCFDPNVNVARPFFESHYSNNLKILKAAINAISGNAELAGKYGFVELQLNENTLGRLEMLSTKVMQVVHELQFCDEFFKLVCHGDFHMWNIAFCKDQMFGKFFDFQMIRYTSGLTDIHQYLSQVTTPNTRKLHLNTFLKTYQESFEKVCINYGLKEKSLSLSQVLSEYRRTSPWGFLFGFFFILRRFVPENFYDVFEKADDDESVKNLLYQQSDSFWTVIKIYLELVIEAEEGKVIDQMEKLTFTE